MCPPFYAMLYLCLLVLFRAHQPIRVCIFMSNNNRTTDDGWHEIWRSHVVTIPLFVHNFSNVSFNLKWFRVWRPFIGRVASRGWSLDNRHRTLQCDLTTESSAFCIVHEYAANPLNSTRVRRRDSRECWISTRNCVKWVKRLLLFSTSIYVYVSSSVKPWICSNFMFKFANTWQGQSIRRKFFSFVCASPSLGLPRLGCAFSFSSLSSWRRWRRLKPNDIRRSRSRRINNK